MERGLREQQRQDRSMKQNMQLGLKSQDSAGSRDMIEQPITPERVISSGLAHYSLALHSGGQPETFGLVGNPLGNKCMYRSYCGQEPVHG